MINFEPIQGLQLFSGIAWAVAAIIFSQSFKNLWSRRASGIDMLAPPMFLIAVNRVWSALAWILFPNERFLPNELFLWAAIYSFSIFCAAYVTLTYVKAQRDLLR